jgi:hypothetical protein
MWGAAGSTGAGVWAIRNNFDSLRRVTTLMGAKGFEPCLANWPATNRGVKTRFALALAMPVVGLPPGSTASEPTSAVTDRQPKSLREGH